MFHLSAREPLQRFGAHSEPIVSIAMDSLGRHYATGAQDGLIRVWNPAGAGMCVKTIIATENQSFPLSCISYTANSRYILATSLDSSHRLHSCDLNGENEAFVRQQQAISRDPLQPVKQDAVRSYSGHVNNKFSVQSTVFQSANRSYLLSGSEDNKVHIWDLESSALVVAAEGHQGAVLAVAANPDPSRNQVASAGMDATVKLWDLTNGQYALVTPGNCVVSEDGEVRRNGAVAGPANGMQQQDNHNQDVNDEDDHVVDGHILNLGYRGEVKRQRVDATVEPHPVLLTLPSQDELRELRRARLDPVYEAIKQLSDDLGLQMDEAQQLYANMQMDKLLEKQRVKQEETERGKEREQERQRQQAAARVSATAATDSQEDPELMEAMLLSLSESTALEEARKRRREDEEIQQDMNGCGQWAFLEDEDAEEWTCLESLCYEDNDEEDECAQSHTFTSDVPASESQADEHLEWALELSSSAQTPTPRQTCPSSFSQAKTKAPQRHEEQQQLMEWEEFEEQQRLDQAATETIDNLLSPVAIRSPLNVSLLTPVSAARSHHAVIDLTCEKSSRSRSVPRTSSVVDLLSDEEDKVDSCYEHTPSRRTSSALSDRLNEALRGMTPQSSSSSSSSISRVPVVQSHTSTSSSSSSSALFSHRSSPPPCVENVFPLCAKNHQKIRDAVQRVAVDVGDGETRALLMVDNRERLRQKEYRGFFNLVKDRVGDAMAESAPLCVEELLALGDFHWGFARTAEGGGGVDEEEAEDDLFVGDLIVERKCISDIVSRSTGDSRSGRCGTAAHVSQEKKLRQSCLRHCFMLLEGDPKGAKEGGIVPLTFRDEDLANPDVMSSAEDLRRYKASVLARNYGSQHRVGVLVTFNNTQTAILLAALSAVLDHSIKCGSATLTCFAKKSFDKQVTSWGGAKNGREALLRADLEAGQMHPEMIERIVRRFGDWPSLLGSYRACLESETSVSAVTNEKRFSLLLGDLAVGGTNQARDSLVLLQEDDEVMCALLGEEAARVWRLARPRLAAEGFLFSAGSQSSEDSHRAQPQRSRQLAVLRVSETMTALMGTDGMGDAIRPNSGSEGGAQSWMTFRVEDRAAHMCSQQMAVVVVPGRQVVLALLDSISTFRGRTAVSSSHSTSSNSICNASVTLSSLDCCQIVCEALQAVQGSFPAHVRQLLGQGGATRDSPHQLVVLFEDLVLHSNGSGEMRNFRKKVAECLSQKDDGGRGSDGRRVDWGGAEKEIVLADAAVLDTQHLWFLYLLQAMASVRFVLFPILAVVIVVVVGFSRVFSRSRFPHQVVGSWICGTAGLVLGMHCCEKMNFHKMTHHEHGVCVGLVTLGVLCNFALCMENNDSRLVGIPKQEFIRVMSDIISGPSPAAAGSQQGGGGGAPGKDMLLERSRGDGTGEEEEYQQVGGGAGNSVEVMESPRTTATKQAQASSAMLYRRKQKQQNIKSDSLYFLQRGMEAREAKLKALIQQNYNGNTSEANSRNYSHMFNKEDSVSSVDGTSNKAEYFKRREAEIKAREKANAEKKSKYAAGGMKYTAEAMANRS
eukprot:gene24025-30321_t